MYMYSLKKGVIITSAGLTNEHLYKLMTICTLTHLHLGNKNAQSFNFYEGVAPILEAVGGNLKKLVLEDFTEIDVGYIGDKCPLVEHLALSGILTYAPIGANLNTGNHVHRILLGCFKPPHQLHPWALTSNLGSPQILGN
jgi:hypothetical protein